MKRALIIAAFFMLMSACASGLPLNVSQLGGLPQEKEKLYTLIYFVGVDRSDVRRAVILDMEDDEYEFRPEVRDFEYEILQNVSLPESIYETEIFFRHEGVAGYNKSAVLSPEGDTIGYEFRPIYYKEFMGTPDLLKISYRLSKDNTINIDIKVKKSLKQLYY